MLGKYGALAVNDDDDALFRCAQFSLFPPARGQDGEEPGPAGARQKLAVDLDGFNRFNLEAKTTLPQATTPDVSGSCDTSCAHRCRGSGSPSMRTGWRTMR
jgi:hypothetical protein